MTKTVIGLTGPTGAGKSTVASVFKKLGCVVIDADILARGAVESKDCLEKLKNAFGAEIINSAGVLDRHTLARKAFSSAENTEKLNQITHPAILEESIGKIAEAKKSDAKAIIWDAALLFESGADSFCDTSIAVIAPPDSRLKRIMARDNISAELAAERMSAQHSNEYYSSHAVYTFNGSTDWSILEDKIAELLEQILKG